MTGPGRPAGPPPPGAARFAGFLCLLAGLPMIAVSTGAIEAAPRSMNAPREVVLCAGIVFLLAGVLLIGQRGLPDRLVQAMGATLVTALTLIPTWVAFGAGNREFAGSGNAVALIFGLNPEGLGRFVFGVAALAMWAYTVFAWRAATRELAPFLRSGARVGLLALLAWALWGRTLEPRARPGEGDTDRLARYIDGRHERLDEAAEDAPRAVVPVEDAWIRAARSRLAAARRSPAEPVTLVVPRVASSPTVDGRIEPSEWIGSLRLPLEPEDRGGAVLVLAAGDQLFVAGDAPADTTEKGYDQLRFYFHLDLTPRFEDERVFVDGRGRAVALRGVRVGDGLERRAERDVLSGIRAAAGMSGHRQFEIAIDAREAGLSSGAPFPAFFEIEGDPIRDETGRFKERRLEGRAGDRREPLWLRVTP